MQLTHVGVMGGTGFLGKALVRELNQYHCRPLKVTAVGRQQCHLLDAAGVLKYFSDQQFDYIYNVAGDNGNVSFNEKFPSYVFHVNTVIGLNVLSAAALTNVKKVVSVVASCAYPPSFTGYFAEAAFLDGRPHPSVACHGYAKRNWQIASRFYRDEFGLAAVCACPPTLYGRGDSFELSRTKVMGSLIRKFVDAVDNSEDAVELWGTGEQLREFMYVEDCAKALIHVMVNYDDSELPYNLGTGQELTIKELAQRIAAAAGFEGEIRFNGKLGGDYRKRLITTYDAEFTPLDEGIRRTVEYYRALKSSQARVPVTRPRPQSSRLIAL